MPDRSSLLTPTGRATQRAWLAVRALVVGLTAASVIVARCDGRIAGCGVVLVSYGYNHGEPIERSPALAWVASIADIGPALARSA